MKWIKFCRIRSRNGNMYRKMYRNIFRNMGRIRENCVGKSRNSLGWLGRVSWCVMKLSFLGVVIR